LRRVSAETRSPETRIFRRVFTGVHMVVAVIFCSMLAAGVWRGIAEIRPEKPVTPAPMDACVERAAELRSELLGRLATFATAASAAAEGEAFEQWSVAYRARLLDARARCLKPVDATKAQAQAAKTAFDAIVRTLDLSAISATHWARHLGPSLDDAAEAIEHARTAD
jgi:hypothetical protein